MSQHFKQINAVRLVVNDLSKELGRELFEFEMENNLFPLKGTSAGGPGYSVGLYEVEDAKKIIEWLKAKGVEEKDYFSNG